MCANAIFPGRPERSHVTLAWLSISLIALSGCATTRQGTSLPDISNWELRQEVLGGLREWQFKGRIAVKAGDEGFDGKFNWSQKDDAFSATVGGPLGIGPYAVDETFPVWQDYIGELEGCTNVHFKLGGINMKINGFDWHKRDLPPTSDELVDRTGRYYEYCIGQFGADRCMFESNFPVDKESCSYGVLWNAFKKLSQSRSEGEKAALFHDTAAKVYGIEGSPT